MDRTLTGLLAMDAVAQRFGCGLSPALRDAIETDLRFPSRAAVPSPRSEDMEGRFPDNVTRLADSAAASARKKA